MKLIDLTKNIRQFINHKQNNIFCSFSISKYRHKAKKNISEKPVAFILHPCKVQSATFTNILTCPKLCVISTVSSPPEVTPIQVLGWLVSCLTGEGTIEANGLYTAVMLNPGGYNT